ncbi:EEF1A lysine methyltransferase 2 [Vitis vinifera]|uniref:Protein-lysine N-methyltransferase CK203_070694 n=1 Tax=Vitis vinifera TaxID=29760 RepID=A0A438C1C9_VITVI|nr:EEF1A lysine methyltransferase 2 [Vitis vinifera]
MAGIKLSPEDSEFSQPSELRPPLTLHPSSLTTIVLSLPILGRLRATTGALWMTISVMQMPPSSDKEEPYVEVDNSMLGLQSHWDATYAGDLANFHVHGHAGEVWFGAVVMSVVASWTKNLCIDISQGCMPNLSDFKSKSFEQFEKDLARWRVLDVGIGNGLLLQELAKQGFSDLTGIDYSEGAINLAQNLADRDGFTSINFLVDDNLETKLERQFQLVMDKGTLDAIGLHPDDPIKRIMYWDSISRLVVPGGILVITSCKSTKDELMQEVDAFNRRRLSSSQEPEIPKDQDAPRDYPFKYLSHFQSDSTSVLGVVGSLVVTVAFLRG